jgi:hypothetical protein
MAERGFRLVGFRAGVPAVAPASAGRRKNEVQGKQEVRRRSDGAELWRTAFARMAERGFRPVGFRAGVPAVAPASAGRRRNEVQGKQEVRRRSPDAELWRTAFARMTERGFRPCWLPGWRASRSSGVSRAKAGGEGSRTPVSCRYVQQRPRILCQSHFQRRIRFVDMRGRTRMLLFFVIRWQAFGDIWNRSIGPLSSVIRTAGSVRSQRKRQTISRRSRSPKDSNGRRRQAVT